MPQEATAVRRRKKSASSSDNATASASANNDGTVGANRIPGAGPGAAPAAANRDNNPFSRETFLSNLKSAVVRAVLMYATLRYMMYQNKQQSANTTAGAKDAASTTSTASSPVPGVLDKIVRSNLWKKETRYDLRVFHSLGPYMSMDQAAALQPFFVELDFDYSLDQRNYRASNVTLRVPRPVATANSSWYAHVFVSKAGVWGNDNIHPTHMLQTSHNLISWHKGPVVEEGTSLLGGKKEENAETKEEVPSPSPAAKAKDVIMQYMKPSVTVALVTDYSAYDFNAIPPTIQHHYRAADNEAQFPTYYPPLFVNEFWLLTDMLRPMNDTVDDAVVEVVFQPISMKKWAMQAQFDMTMKLQMQYGASNTKEADKLKRMLFETNPVLLGTTMIVSLAHSVLEMLAFRNDISHWRSIKSMEGVSVRSMGVKIFMELIIFLYLLDNDTSWMIIIGNAIGIIIEVWKLCKAVEFKNFGSRKLLGFIPWFETVDKDTYSKETKKYDEEAMRYLSYVAYPLVAIYSVYSLVYEKHKSWYSWVVGSLVGAVYAFGFLLMVPAVYINYKLKSVAHLPMKALTYKALNTVIDDLFSFVIKMPLMHRLACFRDDVIFAVYIYQWYIYPTDKSRVNEFGQTFDEDGNEVVRKPEDEEKTKKKPKSKSKAKASTASSSAAESKDSETSRIIEESSTTVEEREEKSEEVSPADGEEPQEKDAELKKTD